MLFLKRSLRVILVLLALVAPKQCATTAQAESQVPQDRYMYVYWMPHNAQQGEDTKVDVVMYVGARDGRMDGRIEFIGYQCGLSSTWSSEAGEVVFTNIDRREDRVIVDWWSAASVGVAKFSCNFPVERGRNIPIKVFGDGQFSAFVEVQGQDFLYLPLLGKYKD